MANDDRQRVDDFINHLMSNPNIKNEPLLIGEGLILNFLIQNQKQLVATFKSPQFFPHLEWKEVLNLIINNLYERVMQTILPPLTDFIGTADFGVLNKLSEGQTFATNYHQERLTEFAKNIIRSMDVRYHLSCVINIFNHSIIEKYINEIFTRRDYLYNELVRVQKTYLESDEYIVFLKTLLVIRNAAYPKIPLNPDIEDVKVNLTDCINSTTNLKKFFDALAKKLRGEIPNVPIRVIELALKSNVRESQTEVEDASSRLLYILCARFQHYKPISKIDRGAETPDKSWFGIARSNAEYYGYDKRMLEELYRIAGDNEW